MIVTYDLKCIYKIKKQKKQGKRIKKKREILTNYAIIFLQECLMQSKL